MDRESCYHGGQFFKAVGEEFDSLERRHEVINADVLDAWFPPSPNVLVALEKDLQWIVRTSPPTQCDGMVRAIARARGVSPGNVLATAGSSDAIFLAFRRWLSVSSRVLILDPMYGEYAHVLERIIGCQVARMPLLRGDNYRVNLDELEELSHSHYDLIVLVNPNSPTGQHVEREELQEVLGRVPSDTLVWVDETYVEYAGENQSLETFAARSANVVVSKSMSKVYALSGARAAYLCGPENLISELRTITPPWAVSLPAQIAAVAALRDPDYYAAKYAETHCLRENFMARLSELTRWEIFPGIANFLLCHLPERGITADGLVARCRESDLFLRDVGPMGQTLGRHALRIAIKDEDTNRRILAILEHRLGQERGAAAAERIIQT